MRSLALLIAHVDFSDQRIFASKRKGLRGITDAVKLTSSGVRGNRDVAAGSHRLHFFEVWIYAPVVDTTTAIPDVAQRAEFVTTHWSVVLNARNRDAGCVHEALAYLCQNYWFPVYVYIRRRGCSPPDAQDLTQGFFAQLLEQNWVARADPARGRFRSFLLGALNHFLSNEWRKEQAQKRGGHLQFVELDGAEIRYSNDLRTWSTPEQQFERKWAVTLLESVLDRMNAEFERENSPGTFDLIRPCLVGDRETQPYAAIAARLATSEGAVKNMVYRLRRRYRQLFRQEVARTVASPAGVEDEMRHMRAVLASR